MLFGIQKMGHQLVACLIDPLDLGMGWRAPAGAPGFFSFRNGSKAWHDPMHGMSMVSGVYQVFKGQWSTKCLLRLTKQNIIHHCLRNHSHLPQISQFSCPVPPKACTLWATTGCVAFKRRASCLGQNEKPTTRCRRLSPGIGGQGTELVRLALEPQAIYQPVIGSPWWVQKETAGQKSPGVIYRFLDVKCVCSTYHRERDPDLMKITIYWIDLCNLSKTIPLCLPSNELHRRLPCHWPSPKNVMNIWLWELLTPEQPATSESCQPLWDGSIRVEALLSLMIFTFISAVTIGPMKSTAPGRRHRP